MNESMNRFEDGLKQSLSEELEEQLNNHRQRFIRMFLSRYRELLPTLIQYSEGEETSIDFLKMEVSLRNGYNIVLGETKNGKIQVIGFTNSMMTPENPSALFQTDLLDEKDIKFVIPKHLKASKYKEISHYDECETGNFVVVKNKTLNYQNDHEILEHYVAELAELVISRYSISMQAKINTIFLGNPNDESINQLVTKLYRGVPYVKMTKKFDPDENIYHFNNENLASNFQELKREYQNKINELNAMLGIQSLGVDKDSGVSETEAKSGEAYTVSNANIYLEARNHAFKKLNKRYSLKIEPIYNDRVASEFSELEEQESEGGEGENNSNPVRLNEK